MLANLKKYQERLKKSFKTEYKRYIYNTINFDDKLIGLFGAREEKGDRQLFDQNYLIFASCAEMTK